MSKVSNEIAARLTAARKVKYDSARSFALAYSIPVTTYSQHETGKRVLGVAALLEYSDSLKISPAWILTGKGVPYPDDANALEKQASLYQYLSEVDKDALYMAEQFLLIKGEVAEVDVPLLRSVLSKILGKSEVIHLSSEELVEFAFETYNSVAQTSASHADQARMVDLSVSSLIRGATAQAQDEEMNKRA